jgi:hypothetical protein
MISLNYKVLNKCMLIVPMQTKQYLEHSHQSQGNLSQIITKTHTFSILSNLLFTCHYIALLFLYPFHLKIIFIFSFLSTKYFFFHSPLPFPYSKPNLPHHRINLNPEHQTLTHHIDLNTKHTATL